MSYGLTIQGKGLDSPLPLTVNALQEIYDAVDGLIERSIEEKDPETAIMGGKLLIEGVQLRGVAVMRLLYKLYTQWEKFGLTETFEDRIYAEWGFHKSTIQRYLNIWRAVFDNEDVPNKLLPVLAERPVNTLARLVRPVNENKLVEATDWERVARAADDSTVRSVITELMHGQTQRGRPALKLMLYGDGKLVVMEGDDRALLAIVRNSPKDLENRLRAKGLERLRNGSGVLDV